MTDDPELGATNDGERTRFLVWAPHARTIDLALGDPPVPRIAMQPDDDGYFRAEAEAPPGTRYALVLDSERARPDPASRAQPDGVHRASEVVSSNFDWTDGGWRGPELRDYVMYELHVGTYTPEGTFDAVIPHLDELADLGVTAIELMPIAQFPGTRNWGYDGVYPYAAHHSYGGIGGLRRLVDACHVRGLAVVLDVVYNHMGPEGNYLREFGPYFTDMYRTPWGAALNFDGPDSDHVRRFYIESALWWTRDCHIDALRVDAVHAIVDATAQPFLQELCRAVHAASAAAGRRVQLIAESTLNDTRVLRPPEEGGLGFDAVWNDDFHHALHVPLTAERSGYYADYGDVRQLARAYEEGFVYGGEYSAFRRRRHGVSSRGYGGKRFVVFSQNHDQVGNRADGARLSTMLDFEQLKLAAAAVILSGNLPLLFMGEEYAETAPFQYFVSHSDPALIEAVRRGRREEFASFGWTSEVPDPQAEATFERSKLDHALKHEGRHAMMLAYYHELLRARRSLHECGVLPACAPVASVEHDVLTVRYAAGDRAALMVLNFAPDERRLDAPAAEWTIELDSADERWGGPGGCRCEGGSFRMQAHEALLFAAHEGT